MLHDVARCVKDFTVKQKQVLVRLSPDNERWMMRFMGTQQFPVSFTALANHLIEIGRLSKGPMPPEPTNNKTKGKK